jgi:molybdopterin converting factor small subunit
MMFKPRRGDAQAALSAATSESERELDGTRVLRVVEGLATGVVSRTCVLLWRGVVNEPRFQLQREAIELVANGSPGDAVILCVIEPTSEPPPQELREAATRLLNELAPKIRCVAFVIEGSGFRAAMIRGVLSSLELMRRSAYHVRYFASVAEATAWIAVETGRRSVDLAEATSSLRKRLNELDGSRANRDSKRVSRWPSWPKR